MPVYCFMMAPRPASRPLGPPLSCIAKELSRNDAKKTQDLNGSIGDLGFFYCAIKGVGLSDNATILLFIRV